MTQFLVKKSTLNGHIKIPSSKSHTLRAILFGALSRGKSVIHHYLPSNDTTSMINACRLLGATIDVTPDRIDIHGIAGKISHSEDVIHAGNSGIILRFCSAIGSLASNPIVITGDHSIRHHRPMQPLLDGLSQLGVQTSTMRGDGFAPVILRGPIQSGKAIIFGEDSQSVSALLIASAFAEGPVELTVMNPGEKPWVGLTLDWFDRLGIPYQNQDFQHYRMKGNASPCGFEYAVPGDFSSAAFPIAAALVTQSELTLTNIDMNDCQGDKELIYVLQKMGAKIEIDASNKSLHVKKGCTLTGIHVDINNFIDAITILAVVACFAEGETRISNAANSKQKECDRIQCISTELSKMGAHIHETDDGLIIKKSQIRGAQLNSYHDHRMAMSLAVAAMGAKGDSIIAPIDCVSKTFPTFLNDFRSLGAHIEALN